MQANWIVHLFVVAGMLGVAHGCSDSNGGYTDSYGDDCSWYDDNPNGCGYYDTYYFDAYEMCCACGGGTYSYISVNDPSSTSYTVGDSVPVSWSSSGASSYVQIYLSIPTCALQVVVAPYGTRPSTVTVISLVQSAHPSSHLGTPTVKVRVQATGDLSPGWCCLTCRASP